MRKLLTISVVIMGLAAAPAAFARGGGGPSQATGAPKQSASGQNGARQQVQVQRSTTNFPATNVYYNGATNDPVVANGNLKDSTAIATNQRGDLAYVHTADFQGSGQSSSGANQTVRDSSIDAFASVQARSGDTYLISYQGARQQVTNGSVGGSQTVTASRFSVDNTATGQNIVQRDRYSAQCGSGPCS